jgi:hypothetical protein
MQTIAELIEEFVERTVRAYVDRPTDVDVNVSISTKNVIVQIQVHKTDCGKIIGKKGRSIEALKIITSNVKNTQFPRDARLVSIEVLEDESESYGSFID